MNVIYKENSPFPNKQMSHTGCILCDSWLRGTIHNFFAKQASKLMTDAEIEEANRIKEERKRAKEEKKKAREEEGAGQADESSKKKKKAKKVGAAGVPDLLTA